MFNVFMIITDRILDAFLLSFFVIFSAVQLETKEGRLLYLYSAILFIILLML